MMIANASERIEHYFMTCRTTGRLPTKEGLARRLETTVKTLEHVCKGYYNTTNPYTDKPHVTRCIDNNDFEVIKTACRQIESRNTGKRLSTPSIEY